MGSEAKRNGIVNSEGFKSRVNRYLHSGDTKHVMAGMAIITLVFGVPWFLMNRGTKHSSHQDYMEKADKARRDRLSSGSAAP
ncbi:hypothetical protein SADUNF_Sadunf03G0141500 [Salix dunnii]|uniref:GAG1At protein n=1 Tax=Salix dunnii TaxID=1413687 RepID=A0A835N4S9_9ROSI|nr:hypothetical protein SADUNF_Sadunf03G0141500 [Salix dunnii]